MDWYKTSHLQGHLTAINKNIGSRIFELVPRAKQFFPFRDIEGEALLKHPYFKGHAMRFINAVQMTVLNLDAWEIILIPNLVQLGRKHANIQGFKHEYFESFSQAMNEIFTKYMGKSYNTETRRAWNKIFGLITSTVEQGYLEEQANNIRLANQQNKIHTDAKSNGDVASSGNLTNTTCPMEGGQLLRAGTCMTTEGLESAGQPTAECQCPIDLKSQTVDGSTALELSQSKQLAMQTQDLDEDGAFSKGSRPRDRNGIATTKTYSFAATGPHATQPKCPVVVSETGKECPVATTSHILQNNNTNDYHQSYPDNDAPSDDNVTQTDSNDITSELSITSPSLTSPASNNGYPRMTNLHITHHDIYDKTVANKQNARDGVRQAEDNCV